MLPDFRTTLIAFLLGLLVVSSDALAETGSGVESGADCPSAHTPYSSKTVLLDLLLNPATRSVLHRDAADLFTGVPDLITRTTIPTFAAIVNVAWVTASTNLPLKAATIARLDADLSAIPVTAAATRARCARYDEGLSGLPPAVSAPSVLVFSKTTGARDDTAINAAAGALRKIAIAKGWTLVSTENGAAINDLDLRHFNLVVWNNVSGDVLTLGQRQSLRRYVEGGGGFAALHGSGGDFVYDWDWYVDSLIGARFVGHPRSHGFQPATIVVDDPRSWIAHGLPQKWTMRDEWYSFQASPRLSGAHVLARLDESTYDPTEGKLDLHMGDHPIAWTRCVGDGRSFYTALGHRPENYDEPHFRRLLERAAVWAAGQGPTSCIDGREIQQPLSSASK